MHYYFIDEDRMKLRFPIYCKGKFKRFSWSDILIGAKVVAGYEDRMKPEQCTGLRDKDGQLIYENDYIENDNTKGDVYLVIFDGETARFMAKEMNGNLRLINKNVRVVGNIHERESK